MLDAQRSLLRARDAVAVAETASYTSLIALYKALGGGWQAPGDAGGKGAAGAARPLGPDGRWSAGRRRLTAATLRGTIGTFPEFRRAHVQTACHSQHAWTPHQPADRVLMALKTRGPQSIAAIAQTMDVTAEAVRQQMSRLHAEGMVDARKPAQARPSHADLAAHRRRPRSLSGHARRNDGCR